MILYRPTDRDVQDSPTIWRPRKCFVMSQLDKPIPAKLNAVRTAFNTIAGEFKYDVIDAESVTTGRDFLLKISEMSGRGSGGSSDRA